MGRNTIVLQNFDIVGVLVMELGKIDHQSRHQRLTGALGCGVQAPGQPQGDGCRFFADLHGCRKSQHVVDGGLHQADGAGDGGADDVRTGLGIAAVALGIKTGDPVTLHAKRDSGHAQTEILEISTLV